jgi:hypothetical protein
MKGFTKLLIMGGLLAGSAAPALADTIQVMDSGANIQYNSSTQTGSVSFGNPGSISYLQGFTFLNSPAGPTDTFTFVSGTLPFVSSTNQIAPVQIASQVTTAGTVKFFVTSVTEADCTKNGIPCTELDGSGYFLLADGTTKVYANYQLSDSGNGPSFTASAVSSVAPTPEPSSLVLLGTGLLGAASVAFRKRLSA